MRQQLDKVRPGRSSHITLATIAEHIGLSKATVTHVLNGRAEEQRIRPETRRRVLDAAQSLGYRANVSARAISAGRFGNIALVQSLFGQYLPRELLLGLTRAIADQDMHLVLSQVPDVTIDRESFIPHTMRELSVDGVLVYRHVGFSQAFVDQIRKLRIPAIYLNVRQEFDCIHPDDFQGGQMATEYLLQLGHERIAYVDTKLAQDEHYSKHDRCAGYRTMMTKSGKTPWVHILPENWQNDRTKGVDQRVEIARSLLERSDRPTAIVAYELAESMAIIRAAHSLGLRIPQDISVIHFHNRIDDRYFLPIQTVSNVMEELGMEAVGLLLEKIKNPDIAIPERAVPMVMLAGETCMPPPA